MEESKRRLSLRGYIGIILVGLVGQIAWAIENQYINLWVFSQTHTSTYITWMTIASSVMATLVTFLMGALSDRLGKRKIFIAAGYIAWGVSVFLFGLMSYGNMKSLFPAANTLFMVGLMNTLTDCLMTFFGSTSNDACFSAFVTDVTDTHNRPKVESILSILPLFATAMMLGIGMIYGLPGEAGVSAESIATPWLFFFLTVGILVSLVGVAAFFLLPSDAISPNRAPYFKNLIYGFRPSTVKKHPLFYITLLSFLFFNIAIDAFMPYYLVYFQNSLNYSGLTFYLGMGIIILLSSGLAILVGVFMEKIGKLKVAFGAIFFLALGSLVLYFTTTYALVIAFATTMMFGYLIGTAVLGAELRDRTPENEVGLFQGVRMVFSVLLPMIIGSSLSEAAFTATAINEYGDPAKVPDHNMFLVVLFAAIAAILPLLLLAFARKKEKKEEE